MSCGEFDIISRFFTRQNVLRSDVTLGSGDDCALVKVAPRQLVATSTDTLVEGTHFFSDISPEDLAYKSIMVNLSDLAAMGAEPAWLSLAITLSHVDERWLERFSTGFFSLLDYYQIQLVGGDTTKGPLSLTLTIQGLIPEGMQLMRSGAKVGDWIYVSGTLGDSAAGLAILQNRLTVSEQTQSDYLLERHLRPQARVLMGQGLRGLAHSAIDISDGLASDLGHILKASGCGAKLNIEALPMSDALRANASEQQALTWALSGGEDYELCFTVPEINRGALSSHLGSLGVPYTCIGQITNRSGLLEYCHNQKPLNVSWQGFDHFGEHHEQ